jgi:hypothetical protein
LAIALVIVSYQLSVNRGPVGKVISL